MTWIGRRLQDLMQERTSRLRDQRTPWHQLWNQPRQLLLRLPWPLFLMAAGGIYLVEAMVFALIFQLDATHLRGSPAMGVPVSVLFAVQNLFVASLRPIGVDSLFNFLAGTFEVIVGLVTTSVVTGLVFLRFTSVESPLQFSRVLCATSWPSGHLIARFVSDDPSYWLNVSYGLTLFIDEELEAGLWQRKVHPLPLLNASTPQLHLTATLTHPLTSESHLVRIGLEGLRQGKALLMAMVEGTDEVSGSPLLQVHTYRLDDIRIESVFADLVSEDGQGRRHVRREALHRTLPVPPR